MNSKLELKQEELPFCENTELNKGFEGLEDKMESKTKRIDFKELTREYIQKDMKEGEKVNYSSNDLATNFMKLDDNTKILAIDTILDTAKDVYGPYGGIYAKFERAMQSDDCNVIKSKDGNSFFKEIRLAPDFANTILHLMRQKTDYIASLKTDTSKDGTTSMAVVSSCISKMLLMNRVLGRFKFPSTIYNILFDIALSEGSKIIDKYKHLTYDDSNRKFLPDGEEHVLNAINTTVNNNPIFYYAYKNLIEESKKSNANILDMEFEKCPLYRDGEPALELKLFEGVSIVARDLNKMNAKAYTADDQLVFLFDGFAELNFVSDIYLRKIYSFLHKDVFELAEYLGAKGVLCIFTRTPENLINFLKPYNESGTIKCPKVPGIKPELVGMELQFRAMIFDDTETGRERFEDLLEVFDESNINVNFFNDFVKDHLGKNYISEEGETDPTVAKREAERLKDAFGSGRPINRFAILPETYDVFKYSFGRLEDTKEGKRWVKLLSDGTIEYYKPENLLFNTKFNSYEVSLMFKNREVNQRSVNVKDRLTEVLQSVISSNTNTDELEYRIRCLSSCRLQPIIYSRTADEREELFNLLLDSQGVFISTMVHGVHGGGNTLLFKHIDEFKDNCLYELEKALSNKISDSLIQRYKDGMSILVDSIVEGYKMSYRFILKEESDKDFEDILEKYATSYSEDTKITYNVITGLFSDKIIEAARTTMDVFSCSLSIAKDMMLIDRCSINYQYLSEFNSITSFNSRKIIHEINKFVLNK